MSDSSAAEPSRTPVVAIVGLGRIGASLGLALRAAKTRYAVWGHDREPAHVRGAQRTGAIDRGEWRLPALAAAADLLFLTEPIAQAIESLGVAAPHMRPGSLVTDTLSVKSLPLRMAAACLPAGVSYIGGHPILGPDAGTDGQAFRGAVYCLVPSAQASDRAVSALADLVKAIGAEPYYIGAEEHDSLMAGIDQVPGLVSAVILGQLSSSPSANDLRRLLGPGAESALADHSSWLDNAEASLRASRAATVDWLDRVLAELLAWRQCLANDDWEAVAARIAASGESVRGWRGPTGGGSGSAALDELRDHDPLRQALLGRLLYRRPAPPEPR